MKIELPEPGVDECAHSERLAALIRAEIVVAGGALDFSRYMELALYAPGLGYYSAGTTKFGAAGDFVTAPELGSLFAHSLARAIAPVLSELCDGAILELGPGSGALAAELLLELERLRIPLHRYCLLERSADLRQRQRETLETRCPHLLKYAQWLDMPPVEFWHGVLITNEVVDALPVRLFALREGKVFTRGVAMDAYGRFVWHEQSADAEFTATVTQVLGGQTRMLPQIYISEISTLLKLWFNAVTQSLECGLALFIDYGYPRAEYYHAQRQTGTLRCHYRHRAHADPLIWPGLQDITASVDFTALAEAGVAAEFELAGYTSQAQFLLASGLPDCFAEAHATAQDESVRYRLAQEVKHLTLPGEMGERFQVMGFQRGIDCHLAGFSAVDWRLRL